MRGRGREREKKVGWVLLHKEKRKTTQAAITTPHINKEKKATLIPSAVKLLIIYYIPLPYQQKQNVSDITSALFLCHHKQAHSMLMRVVRASP